ncbi:MAG: DNA polymerase III subunit beta [Candidatus Latescibacteria bacterium]|nr:DNA polymerase III subunit beta [Candidatus Latescibacterota bacterium]
MVDINTYQPSLGELCHTLSVKRLELVGSAAREDFHPESSDIDVLIEFEGDNALFDRYFELKFGLEKIFGRNVDVIQRDAIKNPHLRASLDQDRIAVYEA